MVQGVLWLKSISFTLLSLTGYAAAATSNCRICFNSWGYRFRCHLESEPVQSPLSPLPWIQWILLMAVTSAPPLCSSFGHPKLWARSLWLQVITVALHQAHLSAVTMSTKHHLVCLLHAALPERDHCLPLKLSVVLCRLLQGCCCCCCFQTWSPWV